MPWPAKRADLASLIIISWRDIPAQVIVKRGREAAKVPLSQRFQEAVDRAAMRAGKGSSDAYLADWQRSAPRPCGEDLQGEAAAEAARLEAQFTDEDLERLIRAKGVDANRNVSGSGTSPAGESS
jgi:Virulence factor